MRRNGIEPGNPGNSGGKKGRSGRKPDWFTDLCADILAEARTAEEMRAAAQDRTTAGYGALIKTLAAYAAGMPIQRHAHSGDGQGGDISHSLAVRFVGTDEAAA